MVQIETPAIRERFVSWVWSRQVVSDQLQTTDGRRLQVVYPGRAWGEGQPDFQGAMIAWENGSLERGDIEIHVRQRDWRSHGHHRDPHYNAVILHVTLQAARPHDTVNQHGITVPTLILERFLKRPLATLLAEWSRDESLQILPCESNAERAGEILDEAGLQRFHWKAAQIEGDLSAITPSDVLWRGTARALGYTANADAMTRLAEHLPFSELTSVIQATTCTSVSQAALGALLGVSGLLGLPGDDSDWSTLERPLQRAWQAFESRGFSPLTSLTFEMRRVRPANHPVRRLAALAQLAERWQQRDVLGFLSQRLLAEDYRPTQLTQAFLMEASDDVVDLLDTWPGSRAPHHTLVGKDRAAEIVINAVLPELFALGSFWENEELARAAEKAYCSFPLASRSGLTRHMATQLFGSAGRPLITSACRQQGLIHLYRTDCRDHHCERCPAAFDAQRIPLPCLAAPLQLAEPAAMVKSDAGVFSYG